MIRGAHGNRVDIAGNHAGSQQTSRGDGEDAGAGPNIENAPKVSNLRELREREQAALGRPVMAGAKSERRLDLDTDVIGLRPRAIVGAVDDKAAGAHRFEAGKALGDPIGSRDPLEAKCVRCRFAGGNPDQFAQAGFVRGGTEVDRKLPTSVVAFESGTGEVLGIEGFTEIAGEPPGGGFVADQTGNSGRCVHALQNSPFA